MFRLQRAITAMPHILFEKKIDKPEEADRILNSRFAETAHAKPEHFTPHHRRLLRKLVERLLGRAYLEGKPNPGWLSKTQIEKARW